MHLRGLRLGLFAFALLTLSFASSTHAATPAAKDAATVQTATTVRCQRADINAPYSITLPTDGNWQIFAGTSLQNIDLSKPVATTQKAGAVSIESPGKRMYFLVTDGKTTILISETRIPFAKQPNTRDLGGMTNPAGKSIKWNTIFRSGALDKLSPAEVDYLQGMGLKTVLDLRTEGERTAEPDKLPAGTRVETVAFLEGALSTGASNVKERWMSMTAAEREATLVESTLGLVKDHPADLKKVFAVLQDPSAPPLLYHCTSGKDRVGMVTVLLLTGLGFDREQAYNDYLGSNKYWAPVSEKMRAYCASKGIDADKENMLPMVKRAYMDKALDYIDAKYGSVENYLVKELGVDMKKLQALYLQ